MDYKIGSHVLRGGKCYHQGKALHRYIRERDNYTCRLCGAEGWQVDHIIPWAVSHDSSLSNLRVLCRRCNLATHRQRKDTKRFHSLDEWYQYIERELALAVN